MPNGITKTGIKASNGNGEEITIRVAGLPPLAPEVGVLAGERAAIYVYKKDLPALIDALKEAAK